MTLRDDLAAILRLRHPVGVDGLLRFCHNAALTATGSHSLSRCRFATPATRLQTVIARIDLALSRSGKRKGERDFQAPNLSPPCTPSYMATRPWDVCPRPLVVVIHSWVISYHRVFVFVRRRAPKKARRARLVCVQKS